MPVEFTVRTDDLKRATKQLQLDRQEFADSDFADLTVSASMVDLKAIGTATSIAANGKQTGTARLPLRVLVRVVDVARTYKQKESTILIDQGFAKVGKTKTSHPDIVVGVDSSVEISMPPSASVLDTLAVASMMTPEEIANAGLRDRVESAQKAVTAGVASAVAALKDFNVGEQDITEIVDRRVVEAAQLIRKIAKE
jgi:hypothetical protein